jgi:hypothetical protein
MSVFSYNENGQTFWRYYINIRSKKNPQIRLQRIRHPWYPIWAVTILTGCRNGEVYRLTLNIGDKL